MPSNASVIGAIGGSLLAAMVLAMVPVRDELLGWWPAWPLLVIIYWCLTSPGRVGIFTAWLVGLLLDGASGGTLGQQALSMALVAYLCLLSHQRWRRFTQVQFAGLVFGLVTLNQFVDYWLASITGTAGDLMPWLTMAVASTLAWVALYPLLNRLGRRGSTGDQ